MFSVMSNSPILSVCSEVAEESRLFQTRTKNWLQKIFLEDLQKQKIIEPSFSSDKITKQEVTVNSFTFDILEFQEDFELSLYSPQAPLLKIVANTEIVENNKVTQKSYHLLIKLLDDFNFDEIHDGGIGEIVSPQVIEYNFYVSIAPQLSKLAQSRNINFELPLPKCYYGNIQSELSPLHNSQGDSSTETLLLDERSCLVLEDLELDFYIASEEHELKLGREELRTVLKGIAKLHALSWAYGEIHNVDIREKFGIKNQDSNDDEAVLASYSMIEESYGKISEFLQSKNNNNNGLTSDLLNYFNSSLRPKLKSILYSIYSPSSNCQDKEELRCLIHNDLSYKNIYFKDLYSSRLGIGYESKIFNWENLSIDSPMADIANLFLTSLSATARKNGGINLIEQYWKYFNETSAIIKVHVPYDIKYIKEDYIKCLEKMLVKILAEICADADFKNEGKEQFLEMITEVCEVKRSFSPK